MFDKVLVLGKGYQLFYGSPAEANRWFTKGLDIECPPHTSTADFILDQANVDFDKSELYVDRHCPNSINDLKLVRNKLAVVSFDIQTRGLLMLRLLNGCGHLYMCRLRNAFKQLILTYVKCR